MKLHALPKKEGFFSPSSFAAMGLISVSMTKQKMKILLVCWLILLTADATAVGWVQFDVTAKLQADIDAGRTNSQFRLSHEDADN